MEAIDINSRGHHSLVVALSPGVLHCLLCTCVASALFGAAGPVEGDCLRLGQHAHFHSGCKVSTVTYMNSGWLLLCIMQFFTSQNWRLLEVLSWVRHACGCCKGCDEGPTAANVMQRPILRLCFGHVCRNQQLALYLAGGCVLATAWSMRACLPDDRWSGRDNNNLRV